MFKRIQQRYDDDHLFICWIHQQYAMRAMGGMTDCTTAQAMDGTTDGAHDMLCECETAWATGSMTDRTGDGWCNRRHGQQAA